MTQDAALEVTRRERSETQRQEEKMKSVQGTNSPAFPLYLPAKSFEHFITRIKRRSEESAKYYTTALVRFTEFLKVASIDSTTEVIKKYDPYDLLDAFSTWLLGKGYKVTSVVVYLSIAKKWMRYHGIKVYNEELQERVELPKPEQPLDEAPSREWLQKVLLRVGRKLRAAFLTLISGIRPQDLKWLRVGDVKWDENPVRLIVPPKGKTRRGWETFLTREAVQALKEHLGDRVNKPDELLFHDTKQIRMPFLEATLKPPVMNELISPANANRYQIRYKYHLYSLKKFFYTQAVAAVGEAAAHALCGRKSYLDTYLRLTLEERRELYRKIEPRLLIFTPPPKEDEITQKLREQGFTDRQITVLKELNLMPQA